MDIICLIISCCLKNIDKDKYYLNEKDNEQYKKQDNFELLFEKNDYDKSKIKKLCPKCKIFKDRYTLHCCICDRCINDEDHHCYWLNIHINTKDMKYFKIFNILMVIDLLFGIIFFIFGLKNNIKKANNLKVMILLAGNMLFLLINILAFLSIVSLSRKQIFNKCFTQNQTSLQEHLLSKNNAIKNGIK